MKNMQPLKKKVKLEDLINEDGQLKNTVLKSILPVLQKIMRLQTDLKDQNLCKKLNSLHSRLNILPEKIRNAPLGLLNKSKKEKLEALTKKVAILSTLSDNVKSFYSLVHDLEKENESQNHPMVLEAIYKKLSVLEDLTAWYEEPRKFVQREPLKGKELEARLGSFITTLRETTSVIELKECIRMFLDNFPTITANFKDLKKILEKFQKNKFIIGLENFQYDENFVEIIRLKSTAADQRQILGLASKSPEFKVTLEKIQHELNFSPVRSLVCLHDLEENDDVRRDSTHQKGEVWYFPGLKDK